MTFEEFHNALRILRSIDLHEVQAAGLWTELVEDEWEAFRDDPYHFFMRCDEAVARKIFSIIERRQPNRRAA